jgi:hypothetical protein
MTFFDIKGKHGKNLIRRVVKTTHKASHFRKAGKSFGLKSIHIKKIDKKLANKLAAAYGRKKYTAPGTKGICLSSH